MTQIETTDVASLNICHDCLTDTYLRSYMSTINQIGVCDCCKSENPVLSLLEIAGILETAIDNLYTVTPSNPNFFQLMMIKDKEGTYEWEREGELTDDIANDLIGFGDEKYGHYIQRILSEKHADWEMATMGESTPFDDEYCYERKHVFPDGMYREWRTFERIVHEESRYYSAEAKDFLDTIFDGLSKLETHSKESVIKSFGPDNEANILYRGRHFFEPVDITNAMGRADLHIGPPPADKAASNRMNAKGISVFYGATSIEVAMAEIRPPVGSTVIMGGFRPIRDLRLLDLAKLKDIPVYGSHLDPKYLRAAHRTHFFKSLVSKMTQPANPNNSDSEYLTTQVIADYILNIPNLDIDGILFPSSQYSDGGKNIILFYKSSRLQEWDVPKEAKFQGQIYQAYADDEYEFEPNVTIRLPHGHEERLEAARKEQERIRDMFGGEIGSEAINDERMYIPAVHDPSISLAPEDMSLHQINAIKIDFNTAPIKRQTYTDRPPQTEGVKKFNAPF